MKVRHVEHRGQFARGVAAGIIFAVIKLVVILPINIADVPLWRGDSRNARYHIWRHSKSKIFSIGEQSSRFHLGFELPLDCSAVLILFSLPLPN